MIDPRRAALIIIDMQGGFINESSALAIEERERRSPHALHA